MLYNVEKCTLYIYIDLGLYDFETLVATLDLKINSRGKNAQTKGVGLGRVHPAHHSFH